MMPTDNSDRWHRFFAFHVALEFIPQVSAGIEANSDLATIDIETTMPRKVVSPVLIAHSPHGRHPSRPCITVAVAKHRQQPEVYILAALDQLLYRRLLLIKPSWRDWMRHPVMML